MLVDITMRLRLISASEAWEVGTTTKKPYAMGIGGFPRMWEVVENGQPLTPLQMLLIIQEWGDGTAGQLA